MPQIPEGGTTPLKPLKWYRKLATAKGRLEAGAFLVEGERAIKQLIDSHPREIIEIIAVEELRPSYGAFPVRVVTGSQLSPLCSTRTPQGALAVVRSPKDTYTDRLPEATGNKILLLEDVQDPGNAGTLIRTAAAFDFSGVILSQKCADPLSPKCVQSTAGSVLSVWLRRTSGYLEMAEELRKSGFFMAATDLDGEAEPSVLQNRQKLLLALGNEAAGLSVAALKASDSRVRIPIARGKAESLNVAVCGAISMYLSAQER